MIQLLVKQRGVMMIYLSFTQFKDNLEEYFEILNEGDIIINRGNSIFK